MLFSHPTGNANVRAALEGFFSAGCLKEFHTALAAYPGNVWERLGRTKPGREFQRRAFDPRLAPLTVQHPFRELMRMVALRSGFGWGIRHEHGPFCIDAVYRTLDRAVARRIAAVPDRFSGVYAYEDGALESFRAARRASLRALYDLPIGYWRTARKLLLAERERHPEWAVTLTGFKDSEAKLARKDAELAAADHIFVASRFTARTLADYPGQLAPVSVIPYGFPPVAPETPRPAGPSPGQPLRLLFVGGLSQRKGIADLFAAVNRLGKHVTLTVIGGKAVAGCPTLDRELGRHRWIPSLPHAAILEQMRTHDVFVFPSLFEGFGLVITEAMSQGTPVITTDRTAGPDVIRSGENGWLVPAGDPDALFHQLENLVTDPEAIRDASAAARAAAAARPWSVYGRELAAAVFSPSPPRGRGLG